MFEQALALFAAVDHPGIADALGQGRWPGASLVQFDGHQYGALAVLAVVAGGWLRPLRGRRIAHAEAFAARLQAFAQQLIAGQADVQAQGGATAAPAPQAKRPEQQARQQAVDQQHAEQPAGPGVARGFAGQGAVAAGADQLGIRQAEAEQRRQRADGLGQRDKGLAAEDGAFPDEAVTAGGEQDQQAEQRRQQGQ
ncbi:hypothetical protein FQZ97_779230 [compost metagenome]